MSKRHQALSKMRIPVGYVLIFSVFLVFAVAIWVLAFKATPAAPALECSVSNAGKSVPSTNLIGTSPTAPSEITTRVLNASGESGLAQEVASQLAELGFNQDENAPFANDELSGADGISCFGQLRYGANAAGNAATLHSLFPCFELINDERADGSIDVVLGSGFDGLEANGAIADTMAALNSGESVDADTLANLNSQSCS